MSRRARQRQQAIGNPIEIAMRRARKLSAEDVQMGLDVMRTALAEFCRGVYCPAHWASLADIANLTETLSAMGIARGDDADRVVATAQAALAEVHGRARARGTWTLYADEIDALQWLCRLHELQITTVSYGEWDTAMRRTAERISQARAGNAPAGATVIVGQLAQRLEDVTP